MTRHYLEGPVGFFGGDGLIIYRRLLRKLLTVEFKADDVERIRMLCNSK